MKQLESLMEVEGVEEETELVMRFPKPYGHFSATENLISVRDASFGWTDDNPLFEGVDFTIGANARIAILGKNGCGALFSYLPFFHFMILSLECLMALALIFFILSVSLSLAFLCSLQVKQVFSMCWLARRSRVWAL
jgi:hypothetical protein